MALSLRWDTVRIIAVFVNTISLHWCDYILFFQLLVFKFFCVGIFRIFYCISHALIVLKLHLQDLFRTNSFCHVFHAILDENGKQSFILALWLFWRKNTNFHYFSKRVHFIVLYRLFFVLFPIADVISYAIYYLAKKSSFGNLGKFKVINVIVANFLDADWLNIKH
jgi:hypothetical protein